MAATNKWEHFDSEIERMLAGVAGLNILPVFDISKWQTAYAFPFSHVQLMDYDYDYARGEGGRPEANLVSEQQFYIYIGVATTTDADGDKYIREADNNMKEAIEAAFIDFTFANFSTDDYGITIESFTIDGGAPAASSAETKRLTAIGGTIVYRQRWT